MAEVMRRPSEFEMQKLRESYGDPIIFNLVNAVINTLNEKKEENYNRNMFDKWKALSRLLIQNGNYGMMSIYLDDCCEQVSEGTWDDFKFPATTEKVFVSYKGKKLCNKIKLTDIAKDYGLKVKGNLALCPFHNDTNKSLSISNSKGIFNCFGCGTKGDIITFVKLMEELKKFKK